MDKDIVPALLAKIEDDFDKQSFNSQKLKKALMSLKDNKATYLDVNDFAIEVGEILASTLKGQVTADTLPDGRMYFNIAERILNTTMKKNYDLISGYAVDVQTELNHKAKLHLKGQKPPLNKDRINGIVNRVSNEEDFSKIKWILDEPIVNLSQSIVDDAIKANADFQAKAGLHATIERVATGKPCKWCRSLAGFYEYPNVPDDVYRRHENCRCKVTFNPGNGKRQNVWTKAWQDPKKHDKIEQRKQIGLKEEIRQVIPTKIISGHGSIPKQANPYDVIDYVDKNGKVKNRYFYGADGIKTKDVDTTNHGNSRHHRYGVKGEHASDYEWRSDGSLRSKNNREITPKERKENKDIL